MSDTKISNMTAASALSGPELFAGVQSGANVKITATQIQTFIGSGITIGSTVITGGSTTRLLYDLAGVVSESAAATYTAASGLLTSTIFNAGLGAISTYSYGLGTSPNAGMFSRNAGSVDFGANGAHIARINNGTGVTAESGSPFNWSNTGGDPSATKDTGLSRVSAGVVGVGTGAQGSVAGTLNALAATLGTAASTTGVLTISNATSGAAILTADAANTLAQRNGTTTQCMHVYKTWTDASNYSRLSLGDDGTGDPNTHYIYVRQAGTGPVKDLIIGNSGAGKSVILYTAGVARWSLDSSGHFLAGTDNTYDIGASGATRPRTAYIGTSIVAGTSTLATAGLTLPAAAYLQFSASGYLSASSDGVWLLRDAATTSFGRLQFGGTTSSFPALKRSSAILQARLADDSAYCAFEAVSLRLEQTPAAVSQAVDVTINSGADGAGNIGHRIKINFAGTDYWIPASTVAF